MKLIKNIPNILTLFNLFLGCMAIVYIFNDHIMVIDAGKNTYVDMAQIEFACYCVFLAAVIDFFDGFVARMLNAQSALGVQLDSLADMVTFALVPGIILFELIARSYYASADAFDYPILYYSMGFAVTIFGALRLAKFNIDERQATEFRGLPTPSMALIVCSLPLIIIQDELSLADFFSNKWTLIFLTILLCYLMVSDIRLLSLKIKTFTMQENFWQFSLLVFSIIILLWGFFIAKILFATIPLIIFFYILISIIKNIKQYGI